MQINKIVRSYSKSINTANYGAPESWVRCEATFEAEVETSDDPIQVSQILHDTAKKMVIDDINAIVKNIRAQVAGNKPAAPAAPQMPPAPANAAPANFTRPAAPSTSTPAPAAGSVPPAAAPTAPTYPATPQQPSTPQQPPENLSPLTNGAAASNPPTGSPRRL